MAGTYWLTILPETSKLRPGIQAALRGLDEEIKLSPKIDKSRAQGEGRDYGSRFSQAFRPKPKVDQTGAPVEGREYGKRFSRDFRVKPNVDQSNAERDGSDFGSRFARGFSKTTKNIGGAFSAANTAIRGTIKNIGLIATGFGIASAVTRRFSAGLVASAVTLKVVAGVSLLPLAMSLQRVSGIANKAALQIGRVSSALLVLKSVVGAIGAMKTAAKWAGILTIGSVALFGVLSALAVVTGGALWSALIAVGGAMGVAAGIAVGILAPAITALKIGFGGLAEGAKKFNEQFKESDEALYASVGERMAPMLEAFRTFRLAIIDTFSSVLQPAFINFGLLLDGIGPRMVGLTGTLGQVGNTLAGSLASPQVMASLNSIIGSADGFFQKLAQGTGIRSLTAGLTEFVSTALKTFDGLGGGLDGLMTRFGNWLGSLNPAQIMAPFVALRNIFRNIMEILTPIFNVIRQIGEISAPALAPGFRAIGDAIKQATPGVVRMTEILMPALSRVMENLAPLIPGLVAAFTPWAQVLAVIAPVIASLVTALGPFAPMILAAGLAVKGIVAALALSQTVMLAWTVATKAAALAQTKLNLAMLMNPIGLVVAAIVALGVALYAFFTKTETGRKIWAAVWGGIKQVASAVWEWLKSALQTVGDKLTWLWQNVALPAFEGIKSAVTNLWNGIQVVWELWQAALGFVGDKISWLWNTIAVPAFDGIKTAASVMWAGVKVIWDTLTGALETVGQKFDAFKDKVADVFDAVKRKVTEVWDSIKGIFGSIGDAVSNVGNFLTNPAGVVVNTLGLDGNATGGMISGPGTGTSDSIVARVSNGEYIVNAAATSRYLPLLEAINGGALPRFAGGGLPTGKAPEGGLQGNAILLSRLLSRMFPQVGSIGGYRADSLPDHPSGRALDVMIPNPTSPTGIALGNTITAFLMKNADKLNVDYTIWRQTYRNASGASNVMEDQGDPTQNHMDHVHVTTKAGSPESFSPPSGLVLPGGSLGGSSMDGSGIGAATSASSLDSDGNLMTYRTATDAELSASNARIDSATKTVREAEQRIDDRRTDLNLAEQKLAELKASGNAKQSQLDAAQNRITKLQREISDAETDAATAKDKLAQVEAADADLRTNGKQVKAKSSKLAGGSAAGGGSDASSLGQTFFSGVLESIGLDGSIFSNPLEWPSVKSIMAGVNFAGGLLAAGTSDSRSTEPGIGGGFIDGAADAVGLGGLMSSLVPGSPVLAPGEINPAVPGASLPSTVASGSAFAPAAHSGAGAAPGPVDNSITINNPQGKVPTEWHEQSRAMLMNRTRTTVMK